MATSTKTPFGSQFSVLDPIATIVNFSPSYSATIDDNPGRSWGRPKGRFDMQPRLMRSRTEVIVAGVCGGLAEYFAIDPVIVRLIFVLVTLTSGIGLFIYPILWLVMPKAGTTGS